MSVAVETPGRIFWTEAELQALPDSGYDYELVNGELVMSPKNNFYQGRICSRLMIALGAFATEHRLGVVLDSSTGFWMKNRNCRAPDVSFVRKERLINLRFPANSRKFFPAAPDLAIEVLSPDNSRAEISAKLADYFDSGTQITWVIDPERELAEVCHAADRRRLIGGPGAELDGEQILPGFRYVLASLFKEWDWE
jgi:Uma2 family endonuclease